MAKQLFLAVAFALLFGAGGLRAQDAGTEIREVITQQIEAFRAEDLDTAFSFASPMIKRIFGNSDRFGSMVRNSYPMVWQPADVRFSALSDQGGRTVQTVLITDQSGALFLVDYEMMALDDRWVINGVWVRQADGVGA
ncbi:MAG: DUF4864 domain-containing protein [Pseudomonadota bacterium]